jgi:hypothetical protein
LQGLNHHLGARIHGLVRIMVDFEDNILASTRLAKIRDILNGPLLFHQSKSNTLVNVEIRMHRAQMHRRSESIVYRSLQKQILDSV